MTDTELDTYDAESAVMLIEFEQEDIDIDGLF